MSKSALRLAVCFFSGLSFVACSSAPKNENYNRSPSELSAPGDQPVRIIDSHTHTRFNDKPEYTSGIIYSKAQYLQEMQENRVYGAITHNSITDQTGYYDDPTHHVINCAGIRLPVNYGTLEAGLKSKKYRCMKIYLGYVHAFTTHAAYRKVYQLAEKYGVPVVFHTGDTYSTKAKLKYADPLGVDEVAVDFPKVTFVIAHAGNPWVESAAEVAMKNPNVYIDASAFLIGDLNRYTEEQITTLMVQPIRYVFNFVENPEKIMFGTDWPLVSMKQYIQVFKRAIPKKYWDQVFYKNARKVFKMDELPE